MACSRPSPASGRTKSEWADVDTGTRTLNLSVRREPGSNVIAIKRAMSPVVEDLNRSLLERNRLQLRLANDDVMYVEDSVRNVLQNLLLFAGCRHRSTDVRRARAACDCTTMDRGP